MTIHKISLSSSNEAFLKHSSNGLKVSANLIYPKEKNISVGDYIGHPQFFQQNGTACTLLKVLEIKEERKAMGEYKDELLRPTFRRLELVRETLQRKDIDGFLFVTQEYDHHQKKMVDKICL